MMTLRSLALALALLGLCVSCSTSKPARPDPVPPGYDADTTPDDDGEAYR